MQCRNFILPSAAKISNISNEKIEVNKLRVNAMIICELIEEISKFFYYIIICAIIICAKTLFMKIYLLDVIVLR